MFNYVILNLKYIPGVTPTLKEACSERKRYLIILTLISSAMVIAVERSPNAYSQSQAITCAPGRVVGICALCHSLWVRT
jgi:hypothetical protein